MSDNDKIFQVNRAQSRSFENDWNRKYGQGGKRPSSNSVKENSDSAITAPQQTPDTNRHVLNGHDSDPIQDGGVTLSQNRTTRSCNDNEVTVVQPEASDVNNQPTTNDLGTAFEPTLPVSATEKMNGFTSATDSRHAAVPEILGLHEKLGKMDNKLEELLKKSMSLTGVASSLSPALAESVAGGTPTSDSAGPSYLKSLTSYKPQRLEERPPSGSVVSFSLAFLKHTFGGEEFSPGLCFPAHSLTDLLAENRHERLETAKSPIQKETWYAFDKSVNPFLPWEMASHGASLVPFFNDLPEPDEEAEILRRVTNVPLFVALDSPGNAERKYTYLGQYTQSRWSDKLSADEMARLPIAVKKHWARILASPSRPKWMNEKLLAILEPDLPKFEPATGASDEDLLNLAKEFVEETQGWRAEAETKLEGLTESDVLKRFQLPDCANEAPIRLYWEYFKCVGYDLGFYQTLVQKSQGKEDREVGNVHTVHGSADLW